MLTKKQMEDLPKGTYTNMELMVKFPTQGKGKSFYDPKKLKALKAVKTN